MRRLVELCLFLLAVTSASAQVSVAVNVPGVSIGINLPVYPELVPVPGYPVYYAPRINSNYFFYDGMYWVYQNDYWYASSWYNGPWALVQPEAVPLYVLRVPVRYYRRPPPYFYGWRADAPPRWGQHWGNAWEQRHAGWDHWDRRVVPRPAPLPVYQRQYSGNRYPRAEEQASIQGRNYRYQPRDAVVQQHYQAQPVGPSGPPPSRGRENGRPPEHAQSPVQRTPNIQHQGQQPSQGMNSRPPPSSPGVAPHPPQPQEGMDRRAHQPQQVTGPRPQQAQQAVAPHPQQSAQRPAQERGQQARGQPQEAGRHGDKGEERGGERGK